MEARYNKHDSNDSGVSRMVSSLYKEGVDGNLSGMAGAQVKCVLRRLSRFSLVVLNLLI